MNLSGESIVSSIFGGIEGEWAKPLGQKLKIGWFSGPQNSKMGKCPAELNMQEPRLKLENKMSPGVASVRIGVISVH